MTDKPTEAQVNCIQADAKRELAAIAVANAVHAAEIERKCREGVSRPELAEGLINILQNKPPQADTKQLAKHENVAVLAESLVSHWYENAGNKFKPFYFLYGADEKQLRRIVKQALDAYPNGIDAKPDELIVFSTSQPGEYWKIASVEALEMAIQLLELDLHCDLELLKGTEVGSCMKNAEWLHKLKERDEQETIRFNMPKPVHHNAQEFVPNWFVSLPVAVGNTIVLLRICTTCYGAWLYRNHVDTSRVGEIESFSDGFGSVGGGPIEKSEYLWDKTVVEQTARDWELRNGKPPTLAELQTALTKVPFSGEDSDEAILRQKKTKKNLKQRN
ncbi:hypothetical protein JF710_21220 [Mycobacterium intracellulare]|uniref:hypothetical protein n=1 Tax=Mycobacterium intracellulare TaxID=1767 RepID=UPI001CDB322E|nr:hypothetical protein [Mycobacterium intracellulare]MCA2255703.1 hypothetical protein [Mycobacterium intracellulare]